MSFLILLRFFIGLVALIGGAELLVRGASRLAALLGLAPLVIGLTVVAFGTGSPELAISLRAGFAGQPDLSLGNIIGSNLFNILVILGISAVLTPLTVSRQLIRLDVPILIGVSVVTLLFGLNGMIGTVEGMVLMAGIVAYTAFLFRMSRREKAGPESGISEASGAQDYEDNRGWILQVTFIVGGLILLILGANWLVDSSVVLAQALGVSELIIGLTVVAAGTSLPEVATSVIASLKGERDIAVGNAIGSSIFNILAVLGLTSVIAPDGIRVSPGALRFDLPVLIAVSLACLPIFFSGHRIDRWEGVLFMGYYTAYIVYVILDATRHDFLPFFSTVMLGFVIPLTLITIVIIAYRSR
ncbi:MAG TPA: calcium/sodium antiporter [bacterium]|nr:calcium/sodium antiporter [bacterium]